MKIERGGKFMRLVPVLDLKAGRAVRAVGGDRANYEPVRSLLHEGSDPMGVARGYRVGLGLPDLYLADLDAIGGSPPDVSLYQALRTLGVNLWVDAGPRRAEDVARLVDAGVDKVIVGLESLSGPANLAEIARSGLGTTERLVFSLDLRAGRLLGAGQAAWGTDDPVRLAERAVELGGFRSLIVLDLARVGTGTGLGTTFLLSKLRADLLDVEIVVGGGIAGPADLPPLARAGASAVLIGSAFHDGRIGHRMVRRWEHGLEGAGTSG